MSQCVGGTSVIRSLLEVTVLQKRSTSSAPGVRALTPTMATGGREGRWSDIGILSGSGQSTWREHEGSWRRRYAERANLMGPRNNRGAFQQVPGDLYDGT